MDAKLEGYGENFGEILDDLDDIIVQVTNSGDDSNYHKAPTGYIASDEEMDKEEDGSKDEEELAPMKEPFEALDEDNSVLEELERENTEQAEEEDNSNRDKGEVAALISRKDKNAKEQESDIKDEQEGSESADN
jgi:hypothetical protein